MVSKKKTVEPFSQYAIIDLPIEVCIRRVGAMYRDNPLADVRLVHDERLDVTYHIATPEELEINAMASVISWQGTQTRVMLRSYVPTVHDEVDDLIITMGLFWIAIFLPMLAFDAPPLPPICFGIFGLHMVWIASLLLRNRIGGRLASGRTLHKRVNSVWTALLKAVAEDDSWSGSRLVEQDDLDEQQYEDYLALRQYQAKRS